MIAIFSASLEPILCFCLNHMTIVGHNHLDFFPFHCMLTLDFFNLDASWVIFINIVTFNFPTMYNLFQFLHQLMIHVDHLWRGILQLLVKNEVFD